MNYSRVIGAAFIVAIMVVIAYRIDRNMEVQARKNYVYSQDAMIEHVQSAVYSEMKNWILFKNGTYVVIEEEITEDRITKMGFKQMEKVVDTDVDTEVSDYKVTKLPKTDGWAVNLHADGMYTYIHPSEFEDDNPKNIEIARLGKEKRAKDAARLEVACVSANGVIIAKE